jgi:MoxR-like ATPase
MEISCDNLIIYWIANLIKQEPKVVDKTFNPIAKIFSQKFEEIDDYEIIEDVFEPIYGGYRQKVKRDYIISPDEIKNKIIKIVNTKYEFIEKEAWNIDPTFLRNLNHLCKSLGFNKEEKHCIAFLAIVDIHPELSKIVQSVLSDSTIYSFIRLLSIILKIPKIKIKKIFSPESSLISTGLVQIDRGFSLAPISEVPIRILDELPDLLFASFKDPDEIFTYFVKKVSHSLLNISNFTYLREVPILIHFLKKALKEKIKGVNVFIYGPPGVGKTEFAKVIAKTLGVELYEVSMIKKTKEFRSEIERISILNLAYKLFRKRKNVLVLFDEADDILKSEMRSLSLLSKSSDVSINKYILNRILEENPIPTIWISNSIEGIDPAYIRRFSLIFKVDYPPRKVRYDILNHYFKSLNFSEEVLSKLSDYQYLTPALIQKAAQILESLPQKPLRTNNLIFQNTLKPEKVLIKLINGTLEALGFPLLNITNFENSDFPYISDIPHTEPERKVLLESLSKNKNLKLLFYGPKGSGKTTLAEHLAKELEKESIVVNLCSEKLSNVLEKLFKEEDLIVILKGIEILEKKESEVELLLLEEVLKNAKCFAVICIREDINFENISILKWFDLKVKFGYLKPEEIIRLFKLLLNSKEPIPIKEEFLKKLKSFKLVIGDFVLAKKRINLLNKEDFLQTVVNVLEEISSYNRKKSIGFIETKET